MKDDKIKPIEERIAELFGRTGFNDMREGFGGTRHALTAADIARALGNISSEFGSLVPLVLETKYASTLQHERALCLGWEMYSKKIEPGADKDTVIFARTACTFAVRELASGKKTRSDIVAHFSWLANVRRQSLEAAIWLIGSWFDDIEKIGMRALKAQFKEAA